MGVNPCQAKTIQIVPNCPCPIVPFLLTTRHFLMMVTLAVSIAMTSVDVGRILQILEKKRTEV